MVDQFALDLGGLHGPRHWARVWDNGVQLAQRTGARRGVVELFALFHDSRRLNEGTDPGHGLRGAELARRLLGLEFTLSHSDMDLLVRACSQHTGGLLEGDVTLRTCWDADRLDLGRVGISPDRRYLCTSAAKAQAFFSAASERGWRQERAAAP